MDNIEWLARIVSCKAQSYEIGSGQSELDWTDKCGVFAKFDGPHLKALASLMVGGDWLENDSHFKAIVAHLVHIALASCDKKKLQLRDSKHTTADLLERMAKMVVYLHLRPVLQKVYTTIFGRLYFVGIDMDDKAYQMTWKKYENVMWDCLGKWEALIDETIGTYRFELKKSLVS